MFETIGATTYRLALRTAKNHPAIRQMLTILTRDESFHVPLNAHFLRCILAHEGLTPEKCAAAFARDLPHAHRELDGLGRRKSTSRSRRVR